MTMKTAAVAVTLALALSACSSILGVFRGASLDLSVPGGTTTIGWQDQALELTNSVRDPRGLAGIRILVHGAVDDRTFTATDFPVDRFGVPESGTILVDVELRQDGRIVATGARQWTLEPNIEWDLEFDRAPYPAGALVSQTAIESPNPPCAWFWCHRVWRFEIAEEARNYPGEALWMTLWRVDPGECVDLC